MTALQIPKRGVAPYFTGNLSRRSLLSKGLEIPGLGFKEKLHEILLHKLLREIYTLLDLVSRRFGTMESKDGKSRFVGSSFQQRALQLRSLLLKPTTERKKRQAALG